MQLVMSTSFKVILLGFVLLMLAKLSTARPQPAIDSQIRQVRTG